MLISSIVIFTEMKILPWWCNSQDACGTKNDCHRFHETQGLIEQHTNQYEDCCQPTQCEENQKYEKVEGTWHQCHACDKNREGKLLP